VHLAVLAACILLILFGIIFHPEDGGTSFLIPQNSLMMIEMIETCCGINIGRGEEELLR
jgi:hypothetical protein